MTKQEPTSQSVTHLRVQGHTLVDQGWPHHEDNRGRIARNPSRMRSHSPVDPYGFALCSCGSRSEDTHLGIRRQQWHRNHKLDILQAQGSEDVTDRTLSHSTETTAAIIGHDYRRTLDNVADRHDTAVVIAAEIANCLPRLRELVDNEEPALDDLVTQVDTIRYVVTRFDNAVHEHQIAQAVADNTRITYIGTTRELHNDEAEVMG